MSRMKDYLAIIHGGGDEAVEIAQQFMGLSDFTVQEEPRWIPAGERLPEEDRLVLWFRPDERWPVSAGRFCPPHHVDEGGDLAVPLSEGKYTHWMPIPEPPHE